MSKLWEEEVPPIEDRRPWYLTLEEQAEQGDEWRKLLQENTAKLTAREIIQILKESDRMGQGLATVREIIERKYGV